MAVYGGFATAIAARHVLLTLAISSAATFVPVAVEKVIVSTAMQSMESVILYMIFGTICVLVATIQTTGHSNITEVEELKSSSDGTNLRTSLPTLLLVLLPTIVWIAIQIMTETINQATFVGLHVKNKLTIDVVADLFSSPPLSLKPN